MPPCADHMSTLLLRSMKYLNLLLVAILLLSCSAPSGKNGSGDVGSSTYTPPAPGTIVATQSVPVVEDQLNQSNYRVTVQATDRSSKGTYNVNVVFGNNTAQSEFTMPRGGETLKPLMRKGEEPYTFIIGFRSEDDDTFYDYYQVSASRGMIEMKYLKAYSFK